MKDNFEIVPPKTRREMEHNIALVFENAFKQVKSESKKSIGSFNHLTLPLLHKLKFLPNGRIFLSSVDERLRLQANTLNNLEIMPKPKQIGGQDSL